MRFGLIMSEAFTGLRRNLSMVVSVVLVTFVSLTFVGAAILMQMQIGTMRDFWVERAQVAVYMCTTISTPATCSNGEATPEQVEEVRAKLEGSALAPLIRELTFLDHQQAYDELLQIAGEENASVITADQVNETFRITLVDPEQSDVIIEAFSGMQGVELVNDQMQYLDPLFSALTIATYIAVGIAVLMLIAAVLLIATTIRLSAYARRRELGIMRLVGASNRFIQTPFILEGVFAALARVDPRERRRHRRGAFRRRPVSAQPRRLRDDVGRHRRRVARGAGPDPGRCGAGRAVRRLRDPEMAAGVRSRVLAGVD